jgi:hypothetical protein
MVKAVQSLSFRHCAKSLLVLAIFAFTQLSLARAAEVKALLDRDSVQAGNGAELSIQVLGGSSEEPELPAIENFIFQPRGQSQQVQIINGSMSRSVTYNYAVGSNIPGDYQIPPIQVMVGGKKLATAPLKLKVLDAAAAQPPAGIPPSSEPQTPEDAEKQFGFLTVELAGSKRNHVYVGEIAPVRIRAWLPAQSRAQLRSGIQPEGKAFTLHNVSGQPQQTEEIRDGKRYLVVTWYGGMSATKAGNYPASLSLNATVAVRDPSAPTPRRRMGGPFDDPFFDSVFDNTNARMIQKDVTLKSDDQAIEVRALPVDGRPSGFTGAVGQFEFDGVEVPERWNSGEPQQISARLRGSGNFSLMNAPEVIPADGWKTYSAKGDFTPGDEASFAGSKQFQFNVVPRKGGEQEVSLSFSFFNPEEGIYKTVNSPIKKVQVNGSDWVEVEPEAAPATVAPVKPSDLLVAQQLTMGPVRSLVPLVSRPSFGWLLAAAAGLFFSGWILRGLRVRRDDPQRVAFATFEKATREALATAARCAETGDVPGFFSAARSAIQQRLGWLWNQPAQAITLADVQARMPNGSPVVEFFREADRHEYSHLSSGEVQAAWRKLFDAALASLPSPAR